MSADDIRCINCNRVCALTPMAKAIPIPCDECDVIYHVCMGCSMLSGDVSQPGVMKVRQHVSAHKTHMVVRLHHGQDKKGMDIGHVKTMEQAHALIAEDAQRIASENKQAHVYTIMNKVTNEWVKVNIKVKGAS